MRRSFTIVSIVVHTFVVAAACIAQLLAVGTLPAPRAPLTFAGVLPVRVIEIPLPRPAHRIASGTPAASSAGPSAPLVAPDQIGPERRSDDASATPPDSIGVERGIGSTSILGTAPVTPAAPPPPSPAPQAPVRLHAGMQPPRKIVHVDPVYPQIAQAARVEGVVILDTVIDVTGHVTSVRVLRSLPLLDQAAVDAVRQWTFTPTLLNGVPVPVALTVTVRFSLSSR